MAEPTPAAKWIAFGAVAVLVVAVWWIVDWRSAPPEPPKVELPYGGRASSER
jgi:hypothetical protein